MKQLMERETAKASRERHDFVVNYARLLEAVPRFGSVTCDAFDF